MTSLEIDMKHLSQLDRAWSAVKMGASDLTISGWGCTTTCLSMASDYFGTYKSPKDFASVDSLYTKSGLVLWGEFVKAMPNVAGYERIYRDDVEKFAQAVERPNQAVLLEVAFPGTSYGRHWVIATDYLGARDFMVIDPLGGIERRLRSKYPTVLGGVILTAKPEWKPTVTPVGDAEYGKTLARRKLGLYLQVEERGELWAIDETGTREYIHPDNLMAWLEKNAIGITNSDLIKVPLKK